MRYNLEYYEKMLREYSATAQEICRKRWDFISTYLGIGGKGKTHKVLDYGSGVGWFRAWRPRGADVWTFDLAEYPQTGVTLQKYDVVCFWDVLEHIPDFKEIEAVLALSEHVAVTIPIKPEDKSYLDWKHLKPYEHVHLFTEDSLEALFKHYGFDLLAKGGPECPPREDVVSFLFRKIGL